jgi:hypothetical protein
MIKRNNTNPSILFLPNVIKCAGDAWVDGAAEVKGNRRTR